MSEHFSIIHVASKSLEVRKLEKRYGDEIKTYYSTPVIATSFGRKVVIWVGVRFSNKCDVSELGEVNLLEIEKAGLSTDGKRLFIMISSFRTRYVFTAEKFDSLKDRELGEEYL